MKVAIVSKLSHMPTYFQDDYLITSLIEKGVDVWLITNSEDHEHKFSRMGARVTLHHPEKKISLKSINIIRSVVKAHESDVLYLMNSKAVSNGAMAANGLPVKVIAYRGAAGFYWHDPTSYLAHFNPRVDVLCCLSHYIKKTLQQQDVFGKGRHYAVVHKGVSTASFLENNYIVTEELTKYNIPDAILTIVCVANVRKVKGLEYLLKAIYLLSDMHNIRVLIIGEGTDTPTFAKKIHHLGLGTKVFGLGFQKHPLNFIQLCDIYVQPSISEGLGKTILEAMALGKATIVTASGGPEELVLHGHSGLIVPSKSAPDLADALNLLILDTALRLRLGAAAKNRIQEEFSIEEFGRKMHQLFQNVTNNHKLSP